jgi:hypothetical protein
VLDARSFTDIDGPDAVARGVDLVLVHEVETANEDAADLQGARGAGQAREKHALVVRLCNRQN